MEPNLTRALPQAAAPLHPVDTEEAEVLEAEAVGEVLEEASRRTLDAPRFWRDVRRRRLLAMADCLAVAVALGVALPPQRIVWLLGLLPFWILVAKLAGLYDADHRSLRHLTVDEAPAIIAWGVIGTVLASVIGSLTPAEGMDSGELALVAVASITADFIFRVLARAFWRKTTPRETVLIVGSGRLATVMRRKINLFGDLHMEPVSSGELGRGIDRLVLAVERIDAREVAELADLCHQHEAKLSLISPLRGRATPTSISRLAELPVFEYLTADVSRSTMMLKRTLDLAVGIPLALFAAMVSVPIATAIWLEDRGPILYKQTRAGLRGAPFRVLKFRTMHVGADSSLEGLLDDLPDPMFKFRDDPRVTRVGRVLRRLSLDELPQLWNLLRGDMSLVGPRPEQLDLVERYGPEHRFRLDVKPGLTGPMQVHGRGELSFEERLAIELDYVENLSVGRDLRIVALTPVSVLRGTGAF